MSKWFDRNGTDVDAYPDHAFKGGVYEPIHLSGAFGQRITITPKAEPARQPRG